MVKETDKLELIKKVELGQKVKTFLESEIWFEVIKPMLDSFAAGLLDASDIDISSDKKAAIEVKSRVEAAKYIRTIETFLSGHVIDGETSGTLLSPKEEKHPLYRKKRAYV